MYCKYCGKEIENNAAECEECREKNKAQQAQAQQNTTNNTEQTIKAEPVVNNGGAPQGKSKLAAGLLGIFLGAFGIHNFYLGKTGPAVGQLLITILSCGILSPISAIWGFIEGILILTGAISTDGNGQPLRD